MVDYHRKPDGLLLLPRLRVQNANAISSPHTWGFPAPSALLGFTHALERRLSDQFVQRFVGVGIVCHHVEPQIFKPNKRNHFVFTQSRNPVFLRRDADRFIAKGTPAAIVEEGRIHLELTLIISVQGHFSEDLESDEFAQTAMNATMAMRLAGGSLLPPTPHTPKAKWVSWPDSLADQATTFSRLRRQLLPGFALVHRPDLLREHLETLQQIDQQPATLPALLDIAGLNYKPPTPKTTNVAETGQEHETTWSIEQRPGWLVPIPIGYAGISELYKPGEVLQTRDSTTPFRFVESLISLGQWIAPHRIGSLEQMMWYHGGSPEKGIYRCINHYIQPTKHTARLSEHNNSEGI